MILLPLPRTVSAVLSPPLLLSLVWLGLLAPVGCSQAPRDDARLRLEREFEQSLRNVTLVGRSTREGKEGLSGEERYVIEKVSKVSGDTWLFQARVQYGGKDYPAPLPIAVQWAGDTPVITLTDFTIPGRGTYTARVLIFRGQYAGYWSGAHGGGQMFGQVVRNGP